MSTSAAPRIALVGAGGLGGPIAHALARAGAELVIFDADVVEPSNLHRQLQFTLADVGRPKAEALAAAIALRGGSALAVNRRWTPDVEMEGEERDDALELAVDLIVDGSDDPVTKFAVADWASAAGLPSVIAGALGTGGNVFLSAPGRACFRCLFEEPPDEAPTCADAGVLGPVVASVAGLAALAALELAAGNHALAGAIWILDAALAGRPPRRMAVQRREDCPGCGPKRPGAERAAAAAATKEASCRSS
jgi:molybdopterin/thiamine biosynthesis adenylyltransferase